MCLHWSLLVFLVSIFMALAPSWIGGTVAVLVEAAARSIFDRRGAKSLTGVEGAALDLGVGNK